MLTGTQVTTSQLAGLYQGTGQRHRQRSFARQVGQRESRLAGTGMQTREVRHYQTGDDLRHIHWKATAKLGEPLTRVFEAENELSWLIVIVLTPDMYFGSQHAYKSVRALEAAALLAWECRRNSDAVGSLICSPHGVDRWAPARTRAALLRQLDRWAQHSAYPTQTSAFDDHYSTLRRELQYVLRPQRPLVVFSDFLPPYPWSEFCEDLKMGPATLVQMYDPLEVTLPESGTYAAAGRRAIRWIRGSRSAQKRYTQSREAWFTQLRQQAWQQGSQWVSLSTSDDPELWSWSTQETAHGR